MFTYIDTPNNRQLRVYFSYGKEDAALRTTCVISCAPLEATTREAFEPIVEGVVKCHHYDRPSRNAGRKFALRKALSILGHMDYPAADAQDARSLGKALRTAIWAAYHATRGFVGEVRPVDIESIITRVLVAFEGDVTPQEVADVIHGADPAEAHALYQLDTDYDLAGMV